MTTASSNAPIKYHVSFGNSSAHYAQIAISLSVKKGDTVQFKMPVWSPGSYKIREHAHNVDESWYTVNGVIKTVVRADKNTWICEAPDKGELIFTYNVYGVKIGPRASYIDNNMAFLHGASAFMYIQNKEDMAITLSFEPLPGWKDIEVALPKLPKSNTFICTNYDLLADSPVALGNFDIGSYETAGVPHKIVMIGKGNYNLEKVTQDFKKITDVEVKMFNHKHPSDVYIHFIQNVTKGGGGLEHLNCQTSQVVRWAYKDEAAYLKFLALVAHEYFHLWNIKRIRPIELGPFDYNRENYTDMLWVVEGITSYFDDLFLRRAGFHSDTTYFEALVTNINRYQNQPGRHVMSLDESSKLAWIKAYMPNKNSKNKTISYYNKGMLVAWMLDVEIMKTTNCKHRLDDVMQLLYTSYYEAQNRGFTHQEFISACNQIAKTDLTDFFEKYVFSKGDLPYPLYGDLLGIKIENNPTATPSIGVLTKMVGGKLTINYVDIDGPAVVAGLSVNDEIIAINGWRTETDINSNFPNFEIDKSIAIIYARDGRVLECEVKLQRNSEAKFTIVPSTEMTKSQKKMFDTWLN
jgi:predicted metalloprotease with PDZ domain